MLESAFESDLTGIRIDFMVKIIPEPLRSWLLREQWKRHVFRRQDDICRFKHVNFRLFCYGVRHEHFVPRFASIETNASMTLSLSLQLIYA